MLVILREKAFQRIVSELHEDAVKKVEGELKGIRSLSDLTGKVKSLREQIETLEIEKGQKTEEFTRKEREIEHKVGLERKRQEFELESGRKEAILQVREENLASDKARFEEQMKFQEERFTKEVGYLKDMLGQIIKRLPTAEFTADLTPAGSRQMVKRR